MKQTFTLFLMLLSFVSASFAQTTITHANNAPEVGDVITSVYVNVMESVDPGTTGGGQTWDFSMYTGGDPETMTFVDPAGTFWGGQVNSNLAIQADFKSFMVSYYDVSSSKMGLVAIGSSDEEMGDVLSIFDDEMDIMHFPFAYGDSFDDTYSYSMDMMGMNMVTTGTNTYEADAWGDISTPNGTFNNVLRVKNINLETTQIWMEGVMIDESTVTYTTYEWYAESSVHPVAVLDIDEEFPDEVSLTFTSTGTGISSFMDDVTIAWPNPTTDKVNINTSAFSMGSTIKIVNNTGAVVFDMTASNTNIPVSLSDLSSGVYFIIGMLENGEMTHEKIIVM